MAFRYAARLKAAGRLESVDSLMAESALLDANNSAWVFEAAVIGRCLPAMKGVPWLLSELGPGSEAPILAAYNQYWMAIANDDAAWRQRCIAHLEAGCPGSRYIDPDFTVTPKRLAQVLRSLESGDVQGLERHLEILLSNHANRAAKSVREIPNLFPDERFTEPMLLTCTTVLAVLVRAWEQGLRLTLESPFLPPPLMSDLFPDLPSVTTSLELESAPPPREAP